MNGCDRLGGVRQRGYSLPELLVVIALLALAALVTVPIASSRIHELRLRSAAERFVVNLRASRMIAVTTGRATTVHVYSDPPVDPAAYDEKEDYYTFTDSRGREQKVHVPKGVWIEPESAPTIVFRPNGALEGTAPARTVLRAQFVGGIETWIVETPRNGIPTVVHESSHPPHP